MRLTDAEVHELQLFYHAKMVSPHIDDLAADLLEARGALRAFLGWQGASEVEDKVKSAELHFRSKGLASVENVEEKFWHCVTSHDISISEVAMKTLERR